MVDTLHFSGTITTVTPDGRAGVVSMDSAVGGTKLAVISANTEGRVALMNGHGALSIGTKVSGDAIKGGDALIAVNVRGQ
jgi:hypothetical protein